FLHRVLAPAKPLVLTAAMRPASALSADGPANLLDAVTFAQAPGVRGVSVVFAGAAWAAVGLRKVHTLQTVAFDGSDCGPLARARGEGVRVARESRCAFGPVLPRDAGDIEAAGELSAVQARVELQLALLAGPR